MINNLHRTRTQACVNYNTEIYLGYSKANCYYLLQIK